ncbi:MAG: CHAD domain-containing protein [Chloroflexota bacterium]
MSGGGPTAAGPAAEEADERYCPYMRRAIAERWAGVWREVPAALAGEDPEGVHQVRVASRRLRAAMDVAAPCFPRSWYRPLHRAARDITGSLGEVRDRDVLIAELAQRLADAPDAPEAPDFERAALERLLARLERERAAARASMEAYLRSLLAGNLPAKLARRFGPEAAPVPAPGDGGAP